jgi:hypothetical protein
VAECKILSVDDTQQDAAHKVQTFRHWLSSQCECSDIVLKQTMTEFAHIFNY